MGNQWFYTSSNPEYNDEGTGGIYMTVCGNPARKLYRHSQVIFCSSGKKSNEQLRAKFAENKSCNLEVMRPFLPRKRP